MGSICELQAHVKRRQVTLALGLKEPITDYLVFEELPLGQTAPKEVNFTVGLDPWLY